MKHKYFQKLIFRALALITSMQMAVSASAADIGFSDVSPDSP